MDDKQMHEEWQEAWTSMRQDATAIRGTLERMEKLLIERIPAALAENAIRPAAAPAEPAPTRAGLADLLTSLLTTGRDDKPAGKKGKSGGNELDQLLGAVAALAGQKGHTGDTLSTLLQSLANPAGTETEEKALVETATPPGGPFDAKLANISANIQNLSQQIEDLRILFTVANRLTGNLSKIAPNLIKGEEQSVRERKSTASMYSGGRRKRVRAAR